MQPVESGARILERCDRGHVRHNRRYDPRHPIGRGRIARAYDVAENSFDTGRGLVWVPGEQPTDRRHLGHRGRPERRPTRGQRVGEAVDAFPRA